MNERGFHLLEVLFVLLLVGLIFGISLPAFGRIFERYRLHLAGQNLDSAVAALRTEAVARNMSVSLHVDSESGQFGFAPGGERPDFWASLPEGVRFTSIPGSLVTFHPRGVAAPSGSYILKNEAGELKLIIALNGRTRWEYLR